MAARYASFSSCVVRGSPDQKQRKKVLNNRLVTLPQSFPRKPALAQASESQSTCLLFRCPRYPGQLRIPPFSSAWTLCFSSSQAGKWSSIPASCRQPSNPSPAPRRALCPGGRCPSGGRRPIRARNPYGGYRGRIVPPVLPWFIAASAGRRRSCRMRRSGAGRCGSEYQ